MASWCDNIPAPLDANGCVVPLDTKELVYKGDTREVYGIAYSAQQECWSVAIRGLNSIDTRACTLPDSWESLEEDARKTPRDYIESRGIVAGNGGRVTAMAVDIVRRAKALEGVTTVISERRLEVAEKLRALDMSDIEVDGCILDSPKYVGLLLMRMVSVARDSRDGLNRFPSTFSAQAVVELFADLIDPERGDDDDE